MATAGTQQGRVADYRDRSQVSVLTQAQKDEARVAALRERKEARRDRFLDARTRTIGVDVDALAAQIKEKQEAKAREAEEDLRYAEEQARMERALQAYEASLKTQKATAKSQVTNSWKQQKVAHKLTKEYAELEDPAAVRRARPMRIGDSDTTLGAASMQVFDGEDLKIAERRALQAVQMKEWCLQMYAEKAEAYAMEKEAERQYAAYLKQVEAMRLDVDKEVEERKRAEILANAAANKRLAEERGSLLARQAKEDGVMGEHEVGYMLSHGILMEDPRDGTHALGAGRKRPDHYRGMSEAELAEFRKAQAEQREARRREKEAEKEEDTKIAGDQAKYLRVAAQIEAEHTRVAKAGSEEYKHQLEVQRKDQEARRAKEKAEEKDWYVTENFFSAFGTSDR